MDFTCLEQELLKNALGAPGANRVMAGGLPLFVEKDDDTGKVAVPAAIDVAAVLLLAKALQTGARATRLRLPGRVTLLEVTSADWLAPITKGLAGILAPWGRPNAIHRGSSLSDNAAQYGPTIIVSQADVGHGSEFGLGISRRERETGSEAQSVVTAVGFRRSVILVVVAGDQTLDAYTRSLCTQTISVTSPDAGIIAKLIHVFCRRHGPYVMPALPDEITPVAIAFAFSNRYGPKRALELLHKVRSPQPPPVAHPAKAEGFETIVGMDALVEWAVDLQSDLDALAAGTLQATSLSKGAFVVGPPGVGKTQAAKTIGAHLGMHTVHGSVGRWLGNGEGHLGSFCIAMRKSFAEAAGNAPSLLIIDEIDALPRRGRSENTSFWDAAVAALLEAIDGLDTVPGVVVLGLANTADIDPALRRSGRLEHLLHIDKPTVPQLAGAFARLLSPEMEAVDFVSLASRLSGATVADVDRLAKDARRIARRSNCPVQPHHLEAAIQRYAPRQSGVDLERTSLHEAGHTVIAYWQGLRTVSVSLVAPHLNDHSVGRLVSNYPNWQGTLDQVRSVVRMLLAGHAAERSVLAGPSFGAAEDLRMATHLLFQALGSEGLGQTLRWRSSEVLRELDLSPRLASEIEAELERCHLEVSAYLKDHRSELLAVQAALKLEGWLDEEAIAAHLAGLDRVEEALDDH